MTDFPNGIVLEARKKGLSQVSNKDGDFYRVSFDIHPDDASSELSKMKLGTRVALVVTPLADTEQPPTEIADDETPKPERPKPKIGPICMRAVLLCKRPEFQSWIGWHGEYGGWLQTSPSHVHRPITEDGAKAYLCRACGIESRKELDGSQPAAIAFEKIEREFHDRQQGRTDEDLNIQRSAGP